MPTHKTDNSALTESEIRTIQTRLRYNGFTPGPIDGILGPRTSAAIVAFKRSIGFVPRPWVGPQTFKALMQPAEDPVQGPALAIDLPWIKVGLRVKGLHERADNTALGDFLRSDGHALGDPAVFPWCGDFVETCIRLALPREPFTGDVAKNPYWALNWRSFGRPMIGPATGCIASITRSGGGHVCFVLGEDADRYYCLGGNQSNTVSIAPIEKSRFVRESFRWPETWQMPEPGVLPMASLEAATAAFA